MSRPGVTPENYEDVYTWYTEREQSVRFAQFGYAAVNAILQPYVQFESSSETDAEEAIRNILAEGDTSLLLGMSHGSDYDPCHVAAATSQSKTLRSSLPGHTDVLVKAPLYRVRVVGPVVRRFVDGFGGIPTFRPQDGGTARMARAVINTSVERVVRGRHLAVFPEGTNNNEDPTKLMKLQPGLGHIAVQAAGRGRKTAIVPVGISYREGSKRHAEVVFGQPIPTEQFKKPNEVMDATRQSMQRVLDLATLATHGR